MVMLRKERDAAGLSRVPPWLCLIAAVTVIAGCAVPSASGGPRYTRQGATMTEPHSSHSAKAGPGAEKILLSSIQPPSAPLPLLGSGELNGLVPYPWHLVGVKDGGRNVLVVVQAGPARIKGAKVSERQDELQLTVYGVKQPPGPVAGVSVHSIFLIQLPSPLGSRRVVEG